MTQSHEKVLPPKQSTATPLPHRRSLSNFVVGPVTNCKRSFLFVNQNRKELWDMCRARTEIINMDLFDIKLRFGVSRIHSVRDKSTVLNVYVIRILYA